MGCLNVKLVPPEDLDPDGPSHLKSSKSGVIDNKQKGRDNKIELVKLDVLKAKDKLPTQSTYSDQYDTKCKSGRATRRNTIKFQIDQRVSTKYDIKALIGRGSFSNVLRVEHRTSKQPYAVKILDHKQAKDVFQSELSVLRRVHHRYVIQLVEVFESRDKIYMIMELATGGELFDRVLAKGYFTENNGLNVIRMIMEGLQYLHGLGITHRDLKPENVLYYHPGADSKILITDFGLSATRRTANDYMQTTCGTPEYIAPEIIMRTPYTCLVDEWAVGVITFILLSGTMPFEDDNHPRLYRQIMRAKYSYSAKTWKNVSLCAKDFIDKLLVVDYNERMTAAQALKHPWLAGKNPDYISKNSVHIKHGEQQVTKAGSIRSSRSTRSSRSNRSNRSLRSEHKRVLPEEIDQLHKDPDFVAELSSLASNSSMSSLCLP